MQHARTEAVKSQQVARFLKEMLDGVKPSVALGRDTKLLKDILDKAAERIGAELHDQPEVEAELRSTLGNVYSELSEFAKAALASDTCDSPDGDLRAGRGVYVAGK